MNIDSLGRIKIGKDASTRVTYYLEQTNTAYTSQAVLRVIHDTEVCYKL
jgi:hypothetical protein